MKRNCTALGVLAGAVAIPANMHVRIPDLLNEQRRKEEKIRV
jgi:hypothetical protein